MARRFPKLAVALMTAGLLSHVEARADGFSPDGRIGVVSDYVSRGLTQSWRGPALQAELEVGHDSGLYFGAFASTVSENVYPGAVGEVDGWIGYEHELRDALSVGAEVYGYFFPGANFDKGVCAGFAVCPHQRFDTVQGRVFVQWEWLVARVGYSFTDYFGDSTRTGFTRGTRGTTYWELNADYPIPTAKRWHLLGHVAYTWYRARFALAGPKAREDPSYWDWRFGVARTFEGAWKGWRVTAEYAQASNRSFYDDTPSLKNGSTRNVGGPAFILGISWEF